MADKSVASKKKPSLKVKSNPESPIKLGTGPKNVDRGTPGVGGPRAAGKNSLAEKATADPKPNPVKKKTGSINTANVIRTKVRGGK